MKNQISNFLKTFTIGDCVIAVSDTIFKESKEATWFKELHTHSFFEIHFLIDGQIVYETHKEKQKITKKQICIVPPNILHKFLPFDSDTNRISLRLAFERTAGSPKGVYDFFLNNLNRLNKITIISNESIFQFFNHIVDIGIWTVDKVDSCKIEALIKILLLNIAEECGKTITIKNKIIQSSNISDMIICNHIEHYIFFNYNTNATSKQAAEYAHISTRHLDRTCKKNYNKNFQTILTEHRMIIALQLLRESNTKLKDIAEQVGYKTYDGFYKAFKRYYGYPPHKKTYK